jgi:hypothetical protein
MLETFPETLNSVKRFEVQGRFLRFDGEFHWFLFRRSPLPGRSGKVGKWYGTNTALEERKRGRALGTFPHGIPLENLPVSDRPLATHLRHRLIRIVTLTFSSGDRRCIWQESSSRPQ